MLCEYCQKYGKEKLLEHLPAKKQYYCKHCENRFAEDGINIRIQAELDAKAEALAKETAKQLDQGKNVTVEDVAKQKEKKTNDEDKPYIADYKKKTFRRK